MSEHENHTESLQDIMARMGEKFFSNSAASRLPFADTTTSVVTQEHAGSKVQEQTTEYDTQEDLLPVAASTTTLEIPDYIQAETFLENVGFFTPSSKRIKGIYTKENSSRVSSRRSARACHHPSSAARRARECNCRRAIRCKLRGGSRASAPRRGVGSP